jgi:hypothetical protein
LDVGAVFNRDGLGLRYAANRGYNPLPLTVNLSPIRIWNNEVLVVVLYFELSAILHRRINSESEVLRLSLLVGA